jgi:hypothetical protein
VASPERTTKSGHTNHSFAVFFAVVGQRSPVRFSVVTHQRHLDDWRGDDASQMPRTNELPRLRTELRQFRKKC